MGRGLINLNYLLSEALTLGPEELLGRTSMCNNLTQTCLIALNNPFQPFPAEHRSGLRQWAEGLAPKITLDTTKLGARTLLGAPGIATRSNDATSHPVFDNRPLFFSQSLRHFSRAKNKSARCNIFGMCDTANQ